MELHREKVTENLKGYLCASPNRSGVRQGVLRYPACGWWGARSHSAKKLTKAAALSISPNDLSEVGLDQNPICVEIPNSVAVQRSHTRRCCRNPHFIRIDSDIETKILESLVTVRRFVGSVLNLLKRASVAHKNEHFWQPINNFRTRPDGSTVATRGICPSI